MPSNDKARRHKHAVKLMEINEKLAQIKAVPLHTKERVNTIKHFSIRQLRMLFKRKQSPVPHQYQTAYDKGEFTRFPSDPATTLIIKGDDGGIIACRSSLRDPSILKSIAILFNNLPPYEATPANRSGTSRGRHPYRHYCVWSPYSKRPFLSKEFKRHGLVAQHFMEKGDALCQEMSSLLGRYFKGKIRSQKSSSNFKLRVHHPPLQMAKQRRQELMHYQKGQIDEYLSLSASYGQIEHALQIPKSTIISFVHRPQKTRFFRKQ